MTLFIFERLNVVANFTKVAVGLEDRNVKQTSAAAGYTRWFILAIRGYCAITVTSVATGRNKKVFRHQGCYWGCRDRAVCHIPPG